MYYAKVENGQVVKFPINVSDEVPGVTFTKEPTEEELAPYGVVIVHDPLVTLEYDPKTHGVADLPPTLESDGKWHANHQIVERVINENPKNDIGGPAATPSPTISG